MQFVQMPVQWSLWALSKLVDRKVKRVLQVLMVFRKQKLQMLASVLVLVLMLGEPKIRIQSDRMLV